jgi:hypothetical protein
MAGIFSPTRSFGATMRSVASPVKDAPKHADLSITQASVHPQDWARRTVRDMDVAASSKAGSAVLRTETVRRREFQEHSLRATDSRVTLALQQRVDETRAAISALEVTLQDTEQEVCNEWWLQAVCMYPFEFHCFVLSLLLIFVLFYWFFFVGF